MTVAKDNLDTIGQLLYGDEGRDAVHIAIVPGSCEVELHPGQWVGLVRQGRTAVVSPGEGRKIGIVDPFLKAAVKPGEKFWVFLVPRTITGLRHVWSHPAFPEQE